MSSTQREQKLVWNNAKNSINPQKLFVHFDPNTVISYGLVVMLLHIMEDGRMDLRM